jgi:bifunctional polynucleotide phosphatase/kinase
MTEKRKPAESSEGFEKVKKTYIQRTLVPLLVNWKASPGILMGSFGDLDFNATKVAGFDFDGTIASWKTSKYPSSAQDWLWFDQSVPAVLYHLHSQGFLILLISNQLNIEQANNTKRKAAFTGRIERTAKELQKWCKINNKEIVPFQVIAATERDIFRKPRPGMWLEVKKLFPKAELSFYCGDAAGRNSDHADTDRKMALNLDVPFYVPEQLFHADLEVKYHIESKIHSKDLTQPLLQFEFDPRDYHLESSLPDLSSFDLLICVGPQASGKSFYCKEYLKDFTVVNQDTLKSIQKCIKTTTELIKEGKKVVVDNTNPTRSTRENYVKLATNVACLWFTTPPEIVHHNLAYREHSHSLKRLLEIEEPRLGK